MARALARDRVMARTTDGRADVGIKRLFLPCCIKGTFYANLTLLHKGKILCQPRLAVTARQAFMPSSLA